MKVLLAIILLTQFAVFSFSQLNRPGGGQGVGSGQGSVLSKGPLPDLFAFIAKDEPVKVCELVDGKYTVLSAGWLTCPQFHQSFPQVETMFADYASKGVQFFYFCKSLINREETPKAPSGRRPAN